jgi:flagellin
VTLDGTNIVDDAAGAPLSAGQYDDAAGLAEQINFAISDATSATYADNVNLRDADGNALVTASDDGAGGITFTSASIGADSSVVARTGTGTMAIPGSTVETVGTAGGVLTGVALEINFTGTSTITVAGGANHQLNIDDGSGGVEISLDNGTYNGQQFVDQVNTKLEAGGIAAEAFLSDDGTSVSILANIPGNTAVVVAGASPLQNSEIQQTTSKLANGDSVISDVATFVGSYGTGGVEDTIGISVDGQPVADLDLSGATNAPTDIDTLVDAINEVAALSLAGSGITATKVGDQVVLSSNSGGSVDVGLAATPTETVGGVVASVTGSGAATQTLAGTAGTATTGDFARVSDGTDGFAQGTFLTSDFDGTGTDFETKAAPMVIEAGVNDTFAMTVDGGTEQTVTITAGSYDTMDELSAAIQGGFTSSVQDVSVADFSGLALPEYDFETGGVNNDISLTVSLDGGTAQAVALIEDDYTGYADIASAQAGMVLEAQENLDTTFGSGKITASFSNNELILTAQNGSTLTTTAVDVTAGTTDAITITGGTNVPAQSVATSVDKQSLVFTSDTLSAASSMELTNGGFAITGGAAAGEELTSEVAINALGSGDLVLNGTAIGAASALTDTASNTVADTSDGASSGIATAAAINASTEQTGVSADVNAATLSGGTSTTAATGTQIGASGTVTVNGVESTAITLTGDADRDRASTIDSINSMTGQTGVVAEDNGESVSLTAADGRNISVAIDNKLAENAVASKDSSDFGAKIGLSSAKEGIGEADFGGTVSTYANTAGTTYSSVTLKSAGEINVQNGVNGSDEVEALGLKVGGYGGGESGTFLKDVDVSTFEGAQEAITALDNALKTVSSQRAELGALQNRFESTSSNLQITSENLSAANSRIRDADFATETAELSRTQVLQQAGISILAQANQRPQQVLSLLG